MTLVLLLLGTLLTLAMDQIRAQADAIYLLGVREELVSLFHAARMEGRRAGWSSLVLEEGGEARLHRVSHSEPLTLALAGRGVELDISGPRSRVVLEYGTLGVAQVASATLVLRRGRAESRLVVSGYGRVRR